MLVTKVKQKCGFIMSTQFDKLQGFFCNDLGINLSRYRLQCCSILRYLVLTYLLIYILTRLYTSDFSKYLLCKYTKLVFSEQGNRVFLIRFFFLASSEATYNNIHTHFH